MPFLKIHWISSLFLQAPCGKIPSVEFNILLETICTIMCKHKLFKLCMITIKYEKFKIKIPKLGQIHSNEERSTKFKIKLTQLQFESKKFVKLHTHLKHYEQSHLSFCKCPKYISSHSDQLSHTLENEDYSHQWLVQTFDTFRFVEWPTHLLPSLKTVM